MSKIEVISKVKIIKTPDFVDACNRSLKDRNLLYGLALDDKNKSKVIFTIYRT